MFTEKVEVKRSNTVVEMVLDGWSLEVVIKDGSLAKMWDLGVGEQHIINTVNEMEGVVSRLKDGETRSIRCNHTGITLFVAMHSMEVRGDYWSRLNILSVHSNSLRRLTTYRKEN